MSNENTILKLRGTIERGAIFDGSADPHAYQPTRMYHVPVGISSVAAVVWIDVVFEIESHSAWVHTNLDSLMKRYNLSAFAAMSARMKARELFDKVMSGDDLPVKDVA